MKNHPLKNDKFRTILGIILAVLAFVVVQVFHRNFDIILSGHRIFDVYQYHHGG